MALLIVGTVYGRAIHQGHYWAFPAMIVAALVLGYIVGDEKDRADYRAKGRAIVRWLGRQ